MSWCWRWRYLRNGLGTCETSKRWINIWMSEAGQRRPLIRRGRYFAVPRMGRLGPSFWTSHTLGFTQAMTGTRGQLGALARGPARRAHGSPAALDEGPLTANGNTEVPKDSSHWGKHARCFLHQCPSTSALGVRLPHTVRQSAGWSVSRAEPTAPEPPRAFQQFNYSFLDLPFPEKRARIEKRQTLLGCTEKCILYRWFESN